MGPSLFDIIAHLGKEETIKRMETAFRKNKQMGLITVEGIRIFISRSFARGANFRRSFYC